MDLLQENGVMVAAIAGVVVLLVMTLFMSGGGGNRKVSPSSETNRSISVSGEPSASSKKKKTKKRKKKTNENGAPAVNGKSNGNAAGAPAAAAAAAAPAAAPAAAVVEPKPETEKAEEVKPEPVKKVEEPPAPALAEGAKKKKKKKSKKSKAAAVETPASIEKVEPAPETIQEPTAVVVAAAAAAAEEEEDDDDDDLLGLLSPQQKAKATKKNKKDKKKTDSTPETNGAVGGWNTITKRGKSTPVVPEAPATPEPGIIALSQEDIPVLIGPKGATIQQLQLLTGAKLDVREQQLTITGTEDQIALAKQEVTTLLETEATKRREAIAHTKTLSGDTINGSDGVKAIIGRGGSTIQKIQSTTGCKLDASIDEGTVVISGPTEEAVSTAALLCSNAVFGEASVQIDLGSKGMVFSVTGKNFAHVQQIQKETGARLDLEKGGTMLTISGDKDPVQAAKRLVEQSIELRKGTSITFEASKIGSVFGKGGTNLRQIQDRTETNVEINQSGDTATCRIIGLPEQVKAAELMIQKSLSGEVELKPGEIRETVEVGNGASAVIGRGGSKIAELEKKHGVKLNIQSESTTCSIVGKKANVAGAKAEIEGIVKPLIEKAIEEAKILEKVKALDASGDDTWTGVVDDDADGW